MAREKKWIHKAIMHKGALRSTARSRYGKKAFTERGEYEVKHKNKTEMKRYRKKTEGTISLFPRGSEWKN